VDGPGRGVKLNCNGLFDHQEFFKVGIFSRIDPQKGQHLVVEAAKMLKDKNFGLEYHIWGDSMDKDYLDDLHSTISAYALETTIAIKGFHPKPIDVMQCYDLIILPSKSETFGLVLAEAMRSGVAVMGTNAGGVPEIIDDNETGLLFNWDDVEGLANKIENLYLNDELRNNMAARGKEKADKLFNKEKHFKTLEQMFRDLITG